MSRLHWIIGACSALLVAATVFAQSHPAAPKRQTFVILYEPGPNWIKGHEIFDQDLHDHGQYMASLLHDGRLLLAGPFSDSSGGLAVIESEDRAEAEAILKKDPGVNNGVFTATLHPWFVVFRKATN